jgi:hypothetical protein
MRTETLSLEQAVARCQAIMAHAWMVRTFVKHSPEVEQFPELMELVRNVFDLSRALETRVGDPAGYLQMLKKKLGKLRKAADKFRHDAPLASTHTNFQQAVVSIDACVAGLEEILAVAPPAVARAPAPGPGPAAGLKPAPPIVAELEDQTE